MKYSPHALRMFVALLVIGAFTLPVLAVPVTLQFQAIVGPPRAGFEDDIGLPFSFAEGDTISGQFTFEPLDVPPEVTQTDVVQEFSVNFTIDGFSFGATRYLLSVDDNLSSSDAPTTDAITLGLGFCNSSDCVPQNVNGPGTPELSLLVSFFGSENTLEGADIPSDLAVWESFDFNNASSALLGFRDQTGQQFDGLIAHIIAIQAVPEPVSSSFLVVGGIILSLLRHRMPSSLSVAIESS